MTKLQTISSFFQTPPTLDIISLPLGAGLFGPRVIESITPQAFLVGGVINALALSIGNLVVNQAREGRLLYQFTTVSAALMLGVFVTPTLSNRTSQWTGVILNSREAVLIVGVNLALKTAGLALYALLKRALFPKIQKAEDVHALHSFQLWPLHFYYRQRPESLATKDLRFQTALNQRFCVEKYEVFPIKDFSHVGKAFTSKELSFLGEQFGKLPWSLSQRQEAVALFYNSHFFVEGADLSNEDLKLISLDLSEKEVGQLSAAQLSWLHLAIAKTREVPSDQNVCRALAERFYAARLPSPDFKIFLNRLTPLTDLGKVKDEETYLLSWVYNYYRHNLTEWKKLSIEDQYRYDKLFIAFFQRESVLFPTEASLDADQTIIRVLHKQYQDCRGEWYELCPFLQKKLLEKFKEVDGATVLKPFPVRIEDLANLGRKDIEFFHEFMKYNETLYPKMDAATRKAFGRRCAREGFPFPPKPFTN